jgi:hypothetical protein
MKFCPWLVMIVVFMALAAVVGWRLNARKRRAPRRSVRHEAAITAERVLNVDYSLDDEDLLDIAIRSNEGIVGNIDALNGAAVGILALPAALGVFAIDKIRELPPPLGALSLMLLLLSVFAGGTSYEMGYLFAPRRTRDERLQGVPVTIQDAMVTRRFLSLYALKGSVAVESQVDQTVNISGRNAHIRESKRTWARISLALFAVAAIVVAAGRLSYPPVGEPKVTPCAASVSTPHAVKIVVQCP